MDKQIIAEGLEKSILDRARTLLVQLPNKLTLENKSVFTTMCEQISSIATNAFKEAESLGCRDFFSGWRRVLAPWWKCSYGTWEYAYCTGFTWDQFLEHIIECNCNNVVIKKEGSTPMVFFANKDGKNQFCIELGKED